MIETFAERLQRLRYELNLSVPKFAKLAKLCDGTVSCYEHDDYSPSAANLKKLADALGVSMDYLWTGENATSTGWISMEDRLPNDAQRCLVYCYNSTFCFWQMHVDKYFTESGWVISNNPNTEQVTHWMPLPEPPKEDK